MNGVKNAEIEKYTICHTTNIQSTSLSHLKNMTLREHRALADDKHSRHQTLFIPKKRERENINKTPKIITKI